MKVTFQSNSRVLGYRPGQIIEIEEKDLTSALRVLLARGQHLTLIDPLSLEPAPEPVPARTVKKVIKSTAKTPAKAEVVEDASKESPSNTEERRPFSFSDNRQSDSPGSGERQSGTSSDSGTRDGGDRPIS